MARRTGRPARVADLVPGALRSAGIERRVAQAAVLAEWARLVGPRIAAVTAAESVRDDGVLVVLVRTAAWAQELSLMTPQIIARVNAGREAGRITGIQWRSGR